MKKSSRIQPLKNLASRHEQQAARVLGQTQMQLGQQQGRLRELFNYREEYQQRFHLQAKNGIGGAQLQAYQSFMQQLDEAIRQQRRQIEQSEQACHTVTAQWREKYIRSQVLDKTIQRLQVKEARQAEKILQRESDELAANRHYSTLE
ncbi:MAG TPA: flagellar export protein FliJ [Gammaproteobacteria bacterium]|nr:flagellar export protein FliJ [Gammaproteobacteria bacterium]